MISVKAKFDGKNVILPEGFDPPKVDEVIVVFDSDDWDTRDPGYLAALEETLRKVWDNPDDAIYDSL